MKLSRFLSLMAACIGLVGAIKMAWSIFALSPEAILHLTSPYSRVAHAPEQIASLVEQKADTLIGVFGVALAFLIEIVSLIFVKEDTNIPLIRKIKKQWLRTLSGVLIIILIVLSLVWGSKNANSIIVGQNKLSVGKLAVKNHLSFIHRIKKKPDIKDIEYIEEMCGDLLGFRKNDSETSTAFLKRVSDYVEWNEPLHGE